MKILEKIKINLVSIYFWLAGAVGLVDYSPFKKIKELVEGTWADRK